jgi:hypothetical protein
MSDYFVILMDSFYDKPYRKTDEQCDLMIAEYIKSTQNYDKIIQKEAWERIKVTHSKRPPLPDVIKVMNQVRAEKIENQPKPKRITEGECLITPQGKYAWSQNCARSFWIVCEQKKRVITMDETKMLCVRELKSLTSHLDYPTGKFERFVKGVHAKMGQAEINFQERWKKLA